MFNTSRKKQRLQSTASSLGLALRDKPDRAFRRQMKFLPEIPSGAKLRSLLEGSIDGQELWIFESSYVIPVGATMIPMVSTIYAVKSPRWPRLRISPRSWMGRVLRRLGLTNGPTLESDAFNTRFKVRTKNEDFAITLLVPEMQSFLLSKTNVIWHLEQERVCLIYSGNLRADRMERSLERMRAFLGLIPEELLAWNM